MHTTPGRLPPQALVLWSQSIDGSDFFLLCSSEGLGNCHSLRFMDNGGFHFRRPLISFSEAAQFIFKRLPL